MSHARDNSELVPRAATTQRPGSSAGAARTDLVVVGDRGRLVLPAAVRAELGLGAGSRLLLSSEPDGSLRLRPYRAVADGGRGMLADLGSGSMVDELIVERRAAAAAEDAAVDFSAAPSREEVGP
jgi:AbrB family looped-hinge helix DNA binding protein